MNENDKLFLATIRKMWLTDLEKENIKIETDKNKKYKWSYTIKFQDRVLKKSNHYFETEERAVDSAIDKSYELLTEIYKENEKDIK